MSVGAVNKQTGGRIPTAGMPAIDDALDLTSVNPVQNAIITAALANKQDKTDNNLDTTAKTIVGAINEHEGDISSLKSGLNNYENQNNLNLDVPNRKNLFDPNSNLKLGFSNSIGTGGTFTSGSYYAYVVTKRSVPAFTISGVDYTKMEDASIRVFVSSSYPAVGAAQWRTSNISDLPSKTVTLSENDKYLAFLIKWKDTATQADKESIMVEEGSTATAYAPYIPSVESRIEAVESGLTDLGGDFTTLRTTTLSGVSYIKCGRLVVVTLSGVKLAANVPINTPAPSNNIVLTMRDESVGGCVQVVMSVQTIVTPSAGNISFVNDHIYSGTIVYISAS